MVEIRTKKKLSDGKISKITGISEKTFNTWHTSKDFRRKLYNMLKVQDEEWFNNKFNNPKFNPLLQRVDSSLSKFIGLTDKQLRLWGSSDQNNWRWKMYVLFHMESLIWLEKYFV